MRADWLTGEKTVLALIEIKDQMPDNTAYKSWNDIGKLCKDATLVAEFPFISSTFWTLMKASTTVKGDRERTISEDEFKKQKTEFYLKHITNEGKTSGDDLQAEANRLAEADWMDLRTRLKKQAETENLTTEQAAERYLRNLGEEATAPFANEIPTEGISDHLSTKSDESYVDLNVTPEIAASALESFQTRRGGRFLPPKIQRLQTSTLLIQFLVLGGSDKSDGLIEFQPRQNGGCRLYLKPNESQFWGWQLGIPGHSELGATTVLGGDTSEVVRAFFQGFIEYLRSLGYVIDEHELIKGTAQSKTAAEVTMPLRPERGEPPKEPTLTESQVGQEAFRATWCQYKYDCDLYYGRGKFFTHKDLAKKMMMTEQAAKNYYHNEWGGNSEP